MYASLQAPLSHPPPKLSKATPYPTPRPRSAKPQPATDVDYDEVPEEDEEEGEGGEEGRKEADQGKTAKVGVYVDSCRSIAYKLSYYIYLSITTMVYNSNP